ncbi:MAG: hypothetical protein ACFHVJ_06080 [Aestuariibacter sp.]
MFLNKLTLGFIASLSILFSFSVMAVPEEAQYEQLFVGSGYPYQDLVNRFDQVRIRYHETGQKEGVSCQVELRNGNEIIIAARKTTSSKKFRRTPLLACMDRTEAKSVLANTFKS